MMSITQYDTQTQIKFPILLSQRKSTMLALSTNTSKNSQYYYYYHFVLFANVY